MKPLYGLSGINLELTNRCNKTCWMCGRRKIERQMQYGDIDFALVEMIARQLPPYVVVQFHNNGEPLLYPHFGDAVSLFNDQIKCVDTNGKLLVEKASEIIDNLDSIAISVIQDDPEADEQYEILKEFLRIKDDRKPLVVLRLLGDVDYDRWVSLGCLIAKRTLHDPMGSFKYKTLRVVPEIGFCLELLHHLSIDRLGNVSSCVRFDPERVGVIGNVRDESLASLWSRSRGQRTILCDKCDYWGIPG